MTARFVLSCALLTLLAGCQTMTPKTVTVSVPVPVPCVPPETKQAPTTSTDAQLVALDDSKLIYTIAKERLELRAWANEVGPVLEACKTAAPPKPAASS